MLLPLTCPVDDCFLRNMLTMVVCWFSGVFTPTYKTDYTKYWKHITYLPIPAAQLHYLFGLVASLGFPINGVGTIHLLRPCIQSTNTCCVMQPVQYLPCDYFVVEFSIGWNAVCCMIVPLQPTQAHNWLFRVSDSNTVMWVVFVNLVSLFQWLLLFDWLSGILFQKADFHRMLKPVFVNRLWKGWMASLLAHKNCASLTILFSVSMLGVVQSGTDHDRSPKSFPYHSFPYHRHWLYLYVWPRSIQSVTIMYRACIYVVCSMKAWAQFGLRCPYKKLLSSINGTCCQPISCLFILVSLIHCSVAINCNSQWENKPNGAPHGFSFLFLGALRGVVLAPACFVLSKNRVFALKTLQCIVRHQCSCTAFCLMVAQLWCALHVLVDALSIEVHCWASYKQLLASSALLMFTVLPSCWAVESESCLPSSLFGHGLSATQ